MITRRNWLLRCSILINVAVFLYICSHMIIGSDNMAALGPSFVLPEEYNNIPNAKQLTRTPQSAAQNAEVAAMMGQPEALQVPFFYNSLITLL